MNKIIKLLLKVIIGIVVLAVLLLVTATILLNTQSVQDDLAKYATEQLELKLGTRVKIDQASVNLFTQKVNLKGLGTRVKIDQASVNLFTQKVNLKGLEVEDQEHRKMLELKQLLVDVDLLKLITREVVVEEVLLDGVKAKLYKPQEGPANGSQAEETQGRKEGLIAEIAHGTQYQDGSH